MLRVFLFSFARLLIVIAAALCLSLPAQAQTVQRGAQAHGDLPGPGAPGVYALRTVQDWQRFQNDTGLSWAVNIDFGRDMVVAVFLGTRNTGGHQVKIEEIRLEPTHTEVVYNEVRPNPTGAVTQMLTNPYVIAVIAQSPTPVVFSRGHFTTQAVPYGEFTRMVRTLSELTYQLDDERRQKSVAQGRVRDLTELMALTGPTPPAPR